MTGRVPVPSEADIRRAVLSQMPGLSGAAIEPLGEGWAFSAFRVAHKVFRFPRDSKYTETLAVEAAVMREVAPTLPLPVSVINVHTDGPNDLPFTSHDFIAGLPVMRLGRPLSANSDAVMGRFIRAMHSFPVERASALGLEYSEEPQGRRQRRVELFERVRAQVLPLVDADIGDYVRRRFEAFLDDGGNFEWVPCLSHGDIDAHNVLANAETGEVSAVIDWGDLVIGDPAGDFTDILHGELGETLREQLSSLVDAAGLSETEFAKMHERSRFYYFCYPLHDVLYSLECEDETFLEDGLQWLRRFVAEGR